MKQFNADDISQIKTTTHKHAILYRSSVVVCGGANSSIAMAHAVYWPFIFIYVVFLQLHITAQESNKDDKVTFIMPLSD